MIRIPRSIYQKMIEHAQREDPVECCGILGGKDKIIQKSFEIKNLKSSSVQFLMDPQEQLNAFEEMEKSSMKMVAIYHSHPHTIPFPSEMDVQRTFDPEMPSIIISLKKKDEPMVKAFRIEKEAIYLEEIELI
jgi:[CysO sulfur-carrier protein]-S-L-cysteine hydrolase